MSKTRDTQPATSFFTAAIGAHGDPEDLTTARAWALARVISDLSLQRCMTPTSTPTTGSSPTTDDSRPDSEAMRGLKRNHTASTVIRGHAFIQNLRRGHYELGVLAARLLKVAAAFDEPTPAL